MIPYNAKESCVKCGYVNDCNVTEFFKRLLDTEDEYIRVICSRCTYVWRRSPLDKKVEA